MTISDPFLSWNVCSSAWKARSGCPRLILSSTTITRLYCAGHRAVLDGKGKVNGRPVAFSVGLLDGGPLGRGDRFEIQWPGYAAGGALRLGDVAVRVP
jgi:hypothetical protein